MKQCVLTGGGSKFGAQLTEELVNSGYHVHLITSNGNNYRNRDNITVVDVNWHTLDMAAIRNCIPDVSHIDLIFFNHNASALDQSRFEPNALQNPKHWQQSYFVACQFPYYYINTLSKKLTDQSKVGWMLSVLIKHPVESQVGFADYIGNKTTNACIMKSLAQSRNSCFFGLHPDGGVESNAVEKAQGMVKIVDTYSHEILNGNILDSQGNRLDFFV
jgi:NAD(P)-dependent dehydrogenase (short-subunit alcohol dehydrogenase family)